MDSRVSPDAQAMVRLLEREIGNIILGKQHEIRLALCCLMADGHLLIEDVPGVGKTTLAQALAHAAGLDYNRLQFTSDMLPADILGVSVYNASDGGFSFHRGPIFTSLLLADEINRATPKAQSALLESMEERAVSVDGQTHRLPEPFFVIATQNPHNQIGTFPLPESQLDRFLMRMSMGYPDRESERKLLAGGDRRQYLSSMKVVTDIKGLATLQVEVLGVHLSAALVDYVQALLAHSRAAPWLAVGLSPRAGQALVRAAKAWAFIRGADYVLPEDVQAVAEPVLNHRLKARDSLSQESTGLTQRLIQETAVP